MKATGNNSTIITRNTMAFYKSTMKANGLKYIKSMRTITSPGKQQHVQQVPTASHPKTASINGVNGRKVFGSDPSPGKADIYITVSKGYH